MSVAIEDCAYELVEKAIEKTRKETAIMFAKKLIAKGWSNEDIVECIELSTEEIEMLRKSE